LEGEVSLSISLPFFHAFRLQKEVEQAHSKDTVVVSIGCYVVLYEDDFLELIRDVRLYIVGKCGNKAAFKNKCVFLLIEKH